MKELLVIFLLATAGLTASNHQHSHHKSQHHKSQHHKDCGIHCGPNRWQAAPCLESAQAKNCDVIVKGKLNSVPNTDFLIQFFNEEKTLVGQTLVSTDKEGNACIETVVTCTCVCADTHKCKDTRRCGKCRCPNRCTHIAATATRLRDGTPGDTSEFSKCVKVS